MKIYLGADHGGFELKELVKEWLSEWGYEYDDLGALSFDPEDDYPQFAFQVAQRVTTEPEAIGILACRSSAGVVIAANKVTGARAVGIVDELAAKHAREHNNANLIALAGDWLNPDQARLVIQSFLSTPFSHAERHVRRLEQISKYETDHLI